MAQNGTDVDSGNINIGGNGGNINIGGNGGIGTDFDGGEGRPDTFSVSTPLPSSVNLSQWHLHNYIVLINFIVVQRTECL